MAFDQIWVCQHLWHLWWISTNLSLIERRVNETWAFEEWWVHRDQALRGSSSGLATSTETVPGSTVAISLWSCDSLIDWMTGGEPVHTNHSFLCTMHYLQSKCTCDLFANPLGLNIWLWCSETPTLPKADNSHYHEENANCWSIWAIFVAILRTLWCAFTGVVN